MITASRTEKIKAFFMICFIALFLINSFFPAKLWTTIMVPIIIVISLIAFPSIKGINKYLTCLMLITGTYLLIKSHASLNTWAEALTKNSGLTVLMLSVPILSIIFYFEDFHSPISSFFQKHANSNLSFYVFTALIINFFGIILNIASIPLVNKLLENVSKKRPKKVFYRALTRGYCLGQIWAPNFVAVAVALQYSGFQWHKFAPLGFLLSTIGMILGFLMEKVTIREKEPQTFTKTALDTKNSDSGYGSILKIIGIAVLLILFILGLQYLTGKSALVIVPLMSVIFPALLAVLSKKLNIYKAKFKEYFNTTLPRMNNEVILFTSVAFLGHALSISGMDKYIPLIIKSIGIIDQ